MPAWAAGLAALGAALFLIVRLARQASAARFQSDECFHAWMAEWISSHWSLPERIEGLYSGFPCFYPPLLHVTGAVGVALFGSGSLRFLGVVVHALLLGTIAIVVARQRSPLAARWAAYLILANLWLSFYAVVLYAEALSTLLTAGFVLALLARPIARSFRAGGASARRRAAQARWRASAEGAAGSRTIGLARGSSKFVGPDGGRTSCRRTARTKTGSNARGSSCTPWSTPSSAEARRSADGVRPGRPRRTPRHRPARAPRHP